MNEQERRAAPRVAVGAQGSVREGSARRNVTVFNLAEEGGFLCTPSPLPAGSRVQVTLSLPDGGQPLEAEGQVMWTNSVDSPKLPAGMGIRFLSLSAAHRARLLRCLDDPA